MHIVTPAPDIRTWHPPGEQDLFAVSVETDLFHVPPERDSFTVPFEQFEFHVPAVAED